MIYLLQDFQARIPSKKFKNKGFDFIVQVNCTIDSFLCRVTKIKKK